MICFASPFPGQKLYVVSASRTVADPVPETTTLVVAVGLNRTNIISFPHKPNRFFRKNDAQ